MRRAIVLICAVTTSLGMASSAAETRKPLKAHKDAYGALESPPTDSPLPDANVIQPLKQHLEYVLPGSCVVAIEKGPGFKCIGPDKDHLKCQGISVTVHGKIGDCFEVNVVKDK